jgi:hypothetical protein
MKKIVILFVVFLLTFPFISSIEIDMKREYDKGETIIASVSGSFLEPLTSSNIYFYRKDIRTSFDYSIGKIGDDYYIYVQTNKNPGDYSLVISDSRYLDNGKVSSKDIAKNFTIRDSSADFSVNPGFVITNGDFYIDIQNLKQEEITLGISTKTVYGSSGGSLVFSSGASYLGSSFTINPLSKKRVNIELEGISGTSIRNIYFSTSSLKYEIPAYIIVANLPPEEEPLPEPECTKDGDCPEDEICEGNECVLPLSKAECITDFNCPSGEICEDRKCIPEQITPPVCTGSSTQSCSIENGMGSQSRTCSLGVWSGWGTCTVTSCNSGYQKSGNSCIEKTCTGSSTQTCSITNGQGIQSRTCSLGVWSGWGTCTVTSCNSGYQISGNSCVPTTCSGYSTQSCSITNGQGIQSRTCNNGVWSSWNSCTVTSCNSGYQKSGNSCIEKTCTGSSTQSCSIENGMGSQSRTCSLGVWSSWNSCTVTSCNSGYQISGNSCVPTTCSGYSTQSCSITNGQGIQSRTCNNGVWSSWNSCTVTSCNSGYQKSGNSCIEIPTPSTTSSGCFSDLDCKEGRVCRDKACVYYDSQKNIQLSGCTSDSDCKGERICKKGSCVYYSSPPDTIVSGCTSDSDCKNNRVCKEGECVYPEVNQSEKSNNTNDNSSEQIKKCFWGIGCSKNESCVDGICVKKEIKNQTSSNGSIEEGDKETEKDYEIIIDDSSGEAIAVKDGEVIKGPATIKTCSEINGTICSQGYICSVEEIKAYDNYCCIGSCSKVENKNTKIIGWLLIGVVLFIFLIFLSKYKGTKRKQYSFSELGKRRR